MDDQNAAAEIKQCRDWISELLQLPRHCFADAVVRDGISKLIQYSNDESPTKPQNHLSKRPRKVGKKSRSAVLAKLQEKPPVAQRPSAQKLVEQELEYIRTHSSEIRERLANLELSMTISEAEREYSDPLVNDISNSEKLYRPYACREYWWQYQLALEDQVVSSQMEFIRKWTTILHANADSALRIGKNFDALESRLPGLGLIVRNTTLKDVSIPDVLVNRMENDPFIKSLAESIYDGWTRYRTSYHQHMKMQMRTPRAHRSVTDQHKHGEERTVSVFSPATFRQPIADTTNIDGMFGTIDHMAYTTDIDDLFNPATEFHPPQTPCNDPGSMYYTGIHVSNEPRFARSIVNGPSQTFLGDRIRCSTTVLDGLFGNAGFQVSLGM